MKDINEIIKDDRIIKIKRFVNNEKAIQLKLSILYFDKTLEVKFTKALDWEHLSVSFTNGETPDWNCMQAMKEMFWEDEEVCFQLHPKKSEYINNCENCLHIWRSLENEIKTPPTILVGFREGNEEEDRKYLKQIQEELGNPLSDLDIDLLVMTRIKDENKLNEELQKLFKKYDKDEVLMTALKYM